MANRSFLESIVDPFFSGGSESPCLVLVPSNLFMLIQSWREKVDLDNANLVKEVTSLLLQEFRTAQLKGEVYTFSLSKKRYAKPVSIIGLNLYEDLVFIEVRPDETRNFLLSDLCDTSRLPEFQ